MSTFQKLFGLAQKALDKAAASGLTGSDGSTGPAAGQRAGSPSRGATAWTPRPERSESARTNPSPVDPADRAAIARYDYLMKTAEPEQIEQVHREAFSRLTPAQRALVEQRMRTELPAHEQPRSDSADDLARAAARTEAAHPGLLKGLLARVGGSRGAGASGGRAGAGLGAGALGAGALGAGALGGAAAGAGLAVGGVLAAVAGGAVLSSVAGPLLEQAAGLGVDFESLAAGVDLDSIAAGADLGGIAGGLGDLTSGAGEAVSGWGDQLSGLGDQVSGLGIPGLDDLFGR